jgi:hypothetical protein
MLIAGNLNYLATAADDRNHPNFDAKARHVGGMARMQTLFIWKSYLLALNTFPASWETDAVCALRALRILTTVDSAKVINILREESKPDFIRNVVRDDDWPPRGFIDLYFKNRDLLEKKLFGGIPLTQSKIDAVEHVRTGDDVMKAYKEMRREDFCDVVAAVVRARNLSEDDNSLVLHLREWVLSEADLRMSYPEWLAGEGRDRMVSLSNEWVHECLHGVVDRRMSFHKWLVSPDNRRMGYKV